MMIDAIAFGGLPESADMTASHPVVDIVPVPSGTLDLSEAFRRVRDEAPPSAAIGVAPTA
jgi:hypothetical protein